MNKTSKKKSAPGKQSNASNSPRVSKGVARNKAKVEDTKKVYDLLNGSNIKINESAVAHKKPPVADSLVRAGNLFADTNEFFALREVSGFSIEDLARLIGTTDRTIRTKRDKGETFDISQTERLRKLTQLFQEGIQVIGSEQSFNQWLQKPSYGLDYAIPAELLKQPGGLDMVLQEMAAIKYGDTV